jgi:hypothetical protein
MREILLKKLKELGSLDLYLKLKDRSDEVIKYYIKDLKPKRVKKKVKNI